MSFKIDGLDDLMKELNRMKRAAKELDGTHEVPFSELFTQSFMQKHTQFTSFGEWLKNGGFHVETSEEFEAIPDEPFDAYVVSSTSFSSWDDMIGAATKQYVSRKLGFQ